MENLKELFKNPTSEYRTAPLWVWNDTMEYEQIDTILEELKSHGFGGAFVHPRPGLMVPYLSDEWFDKWKHALSTSKKLGMKLYIYDENSYPSGFGGGHVSAELPDCLATSVRFELISADSLQVSGNEQEIWFGGTNYIKIFACNINKNNTLELSKDVTELPKSDWHKYGKLFSILSFVEAKTESWLGGFANVDLARPEAAQVFLNKVYEPYFVRFGDDFGKNIPAIFTDEPALTGSNLYGTGGGNVLPFSFWFAYQFKQRNGYDLTDYLPALFYDTTAPWFQTDDKKVRFDYYCTCHELWTNNFIIPMSSWCEKHGVKWTGHFMEDNWPRASLQVVSTSVMSNYQYMGWPAIDMIMNNRIIDKPNDILRLIIQEVKSVANQLDKPRVLCESFGAGGWDSTLEDFKKLSDWLMVNGINFINQHLTFSSLVGARKRDHPQSFDWREPWWDDYTGLNDYIARLSFILSQGKSKQRILILHPTTTGYLKSQNSEPANLLRDTICQNPNMEGYFELLQILSDNQWDYDLGDEFVLQKNASVKNGILNVGVQSYHLIIIPQEIESMFSTTAGFLYDYLTQGGIILTNGDIHARINGLENREEMYKLIRHDNFKISSCNKVLENSIAQYVPKRLHNTKSWPSGFEHMRRELDKDHTLYFFVNHSLQTVDNEIIIEGKSIEFWSPWTGEQNTYPYENTETGIKIKLHLKNFESQVFIVKKQIVSDYKGEVYPFINIDKMNKTVPLLISIKPESKNVYPIDYCTLQLDEKTYENINTIFANKLIYKQRGFSKNPWDNEIHYKYRLSDYNQFKERSGFTAIYEFIVSEHFIAEDMELIVEYGNAYEGILNGHKISWKTGNTFLDYKNICADITDYIIPGKNIIVLQNYIFDIKYELEPIYIRGNFSVNSYKDNWLLTNTNKITYGTWVTQGYPFYENAFDYTYQLKLDGNSQVIVELPKAETTCMTLLFNGVSLGIVGINGNYRFDVTHLIKEKENTAVVRVCSGLKNLLGPHHDPSHPRKTAWPNMWRLAPAFGQPEPSKYDFIPYGLQDGIKVYTF